MSAGRPFAEKLLDTGLPVDICAQRASIWAQMSAERASAKNSSIRGLPAAICE